MSHFRATHDFTGDVFAGQLSLRAGDMITVKNKDANGWWYGTIVGSERSGWFPASYVQPAMSPPQQQPQQQPGHPPFAHAVPVAATRPSVITNTSGWPATNNPFDEDVFDFDGPIMGGSATPPEPVVVPVPTGPRSPERARFGSRVGAGLSKMGSSAKHVGSKTGNAIGKAARSATHAVQGNKQGGGNSSATTATQGASVVPPPQLQTAEPPSPQSKPSNWFKRGLQNSSMGGKQQPDTYVSTSNTTSTTVRTSDHGGCRNSGNGAAITTTSQTVRTRQDHDHRSAGEKIGRTVGHAAVWHGTSRLLRGDIRGAMRSGVVGAGAFAVEGNSRANRQQQQGNGK